MVAVDPTHAGTRHTGLSLFGGWLPVTLEVAAIVVLVAAIGWRTGRWRLLWMPVAVALGVIGALVAHWYVDDQGLSSDPAPPALWIWIGVTVVAVVVAVVGWRGSSWWRRTLSVLAVPLSVLCAAITADQWVGYYPTVQAAWGAVTAGPLPDEVSADQLPALRDSAPTTGKVVPVDVPDTGDGFAHRTEYVYLPPAWFTGPTPPTLPVLMMIGGEFNTPADWMRSGNIVPAVDEYAAGHGGVSPVLVFVDAGGSFNNDTECVDGPRGNAADHLTGDVRPYVIDTFGASAAATNWGIVGWSMGGTCAIDLTVMHPDLFSSFVDIAGDHGPTAGTRDQTIERLYGGDAASWAAYDPATVMAAHGAYTGVSGLFEDTSDPRRTGGVGRSPSGPGTADTRTGMGGHDGTPDTDEKGAATDLCRAATAVAISCRAIAAPGGHTWQFASAAFADSFPWIAAQVTAPGATPAPMPGA